MKVVVVGAGIGGSALALALARLGVDYVLLEQAPAFTEVGAGIQLSPNGVRVLECLGLGDELVGFCTEPDFHKYSLWDTGETILRTPLKPRVRREYGFAYYHAHRADLIAALTRALDPLRLRLNARIVAVGQDGSGAWAESESGERIAGDLLIGADGIHSVVREQVFSPDPPRASGYVTWRGVVSRRKIGDLGIEVSAHVDMGPRLSFVYYYVSGGSRLNWLALGQTDDPKRESWSQTARFDEVIAAFDGWYDRPRRVIEATDETFVTALYDRNPLRAWVRGRIALMGDAAHAMLPYHAQGAVQSLEDAWVLARLLGASDGDVAADLLRYQSLRMGRANLIVQQSRNAEGWYHLDDPGEMAARNERFRRNNEKLDGGFSPQQHWLYSYDADAAALGTDDEWRALRPWS
ncbi:MAG: FAD-dependent monooxygenase [Gammaproteobacteria bacterium]|nr:FAD-dependent monooxygenase [Gammaproteobacteria bacterium]MDE0365688.1 FAD-dependent monooxygenase [Gammaproteobacteria bacterium]